MCTHVCWWFGLSVMPTLETSRTVACQTLSMGFSRREYWRGLPGVRHNFPQVYSPPFSQAANPSLVKSIPFCNPMDSSPPGSSIYEISQARIPAWAAISFSRGSSGPRDRTHISCTGRGLFISEPPGKPNASLNRHPPPTPLHLSSLFPLLGQKRSREQQENPPRS